MSRPTPPDPAHASQDECLRALEAITSEWTSHARLASLAGLSRRRFQLAVTDLVRDGEAILSGPRGFRRSYHAEELEDAAGRLRHRAREILARALALEATAAKLRPRPRLLDQPALPLDIPAAQA